MDKAVRRWEEVFTAIWRLVMPVTSLLVIPSVQGTTLAYIFAFLSLSFVFVGLKAQGLNERNREYLCLLFLIALIWLALLVGRRP